MRNQIIAATFSIALIGGTMSTGPALAEDLSASDSCQTRATNNFGKRDSCEFDLSIQAPPGASIDPDSVKLIRNRASNIASCVGPKFVFDGDRLVAVEASGEAKSSIVPGERSEIACLLEADLAG